jgi:uncharacterized integral membrane protein
MKRLLQFIILAPVAVIGVAFAVANRHEVIVSFDPFSGDMAGGRIALPLFLVLILAMMCGVVIGGAVTWLAQGRHRRALRDARSDAARWRNEAQSTRAQPARNPAPFGQSRYPAPQEPSAGAERKLLTHS